MAGSTQKFGTGSPMSSVSTQIAPPGRLREFWNYFSENRGAVIGLWVFGILLVLAILAPVIAPHSPIEQYRDHFLQPPVWEDGGSWEFILGTDPTGRDMLSRLLYGARFSFFIGLVVVAIAATGGILIGLIAGFARGWVDTLINSDCIDDGVPVLVGLMFGWLDG